LSSSKKTRLLRERRVESWVSKVLNPLHKGNAGIVVGSDVQIIQEPNPGSNVSMVRISSSYFFRVPLQTWGRDEKEAGILYRAHAASR
jgi:hypothetical protein